jgi:hypothetical protein
VIYAGSDFATVDRGDDRVEVVLDAAIWTVEKISAGGQDQSGEPLSLRARLAEISSASESIRMVVTDGRAIVGSIDVVAADHVEMSQDGNTVVVPIRLIGAMIRSTARF